MEMGDEMELINIIRDSRGRLVVVILFRTRNSATAASGVQYQTYAGNQKLASIGSSQHL